MPAAFKEAWILDLQRCKLSRMYLKFILIQIQRQQAVAFNDFNLIINVGKFDAVVSVEK
jgi:hypothetical protein